MDFDPMKPIWVQVANRIKQQIVAGTIAPGSKLSGGRDLAQQYGINPNTAARIYQELEREGICATRRGMGTYVTGDEERIRSLKESMIRESLERFLSDLAGLGIRMEEALLWLQKEEEKHDHE